jgi:hypothetical protein
MHFLKLLSKTAIRVFTQAWQFPHTLATALTQRRRRSELDALEAERLDRIRNPAKYLGR